MVFRRGLGLRPINSVKNIVDLINITVAAGTTTTVALASTVNDYTGGSTEVPIGAKITSMYLFVQAINDVLPLTNVDWYVWKGPGNLAATMPIPSGTGGDQNRRYILHEEKGIPGAADDGAAPLTFRGVIKIPRGRQRFGEGDVMQIKVRGVSAHTWCAKIIYKFYQ